MTSSPKGRVDILLPREVRDPSAASLALCELVVGRLLASTVDPVLLSVDMSASHVRSNDTGVKEAITLILRSGRLDEFYRQFVQLLHRSDAIQNPSLHCEVEGKKVTLEVIDRGAFPNFAWEIRKHQVI